MSIAMVTHTLLDPSGWTQRQKITDDLERLRAQNAVLEERVTELRQEIKALRQRDEVRERAVRNELGYVRPGEMVVELRPNATP
ncbi:MAG: hypothetical protein A2289_04060 [Deltaproteobacteria bacterium RIFOXYA12_FULL_58_15]|nr:MAG: hypothetical protein A2289_04060 [Deltaproteobacteria bacterium RIFOXYA12_FULL_58_15]OGR14595.1 MAG: hypothetical protein A2341_07470 [Deltaproteobacteria bacterium RIFOXYB12_FULL_58_9]